MTKVLWKLKHEIHKRIDPWSMNKHSNRGLCQSWFLLGFIIRMDNFEKKNICLSEKWKVWKYPHEKGKDKEKKEKKKKNRHTLVHAKGTKKKKENIYKK